MALGDLVDIRSRLAHQEDAMQVLKMLQESSGRSLVGVHATRRAVLWAGVRALLWGKQLWLTALGRNVGGRVDEKHSIKRIDRLLGNRYLRVEGLDWYGWVAALVLGGCRRPVMLVDWSDLDGERRLYVLRAAVAVGCRALPIYEEVHERLGDRHVHRRFLNRLAGLLGEGCRPIVVTDAGFRTWWYELVEARGWDYVGRLRNRDLLRRPGEASWWSNKDVHSQATSRPRSLGSLVIQGVPTPDAILSGQETSQGSLEANPYWRTVSVGAEPEAFAA